MENKEIQNKGRTLEGLVIGTGMNHTIRVEVTRTVRHPLYQKIMKKSKSYMVDADEKSVQIGDMVIISETRPLSKNKHFRLITKKKI